MSDGLGVDTAPAAAGQGTGSRHSHQTAPDKSKNISNGTSFPHSIHMLHPCCTREGGLGKGGGNMSSTEGTED
ncbi:hypothetical protein EXIGLDRAFT_737187 [Exidia glandulosa HHB12029]|uniref:Uncharacterized protein n=1 Tax=Exidia glandulosa HHB12029 TaxID=1314781 RepID=A0A165J462_EXIGL|nr:hypothetical protein EXIGLDRAFT_737187 [Exidia glandulosa HHB12029]